MGSFISLCLLDPSRPASHHILLVVLYHCSDSCSDCMFHIQNVDALELRISFPKSLYCFAVFRKHGELGRICNSAVNLYGFLFLVLRMSEKECIKAMESNSHMAVKTLSKHNKASCAELAGELVVPEALTGKSVPVLRDCSQIVRAANLAVGCESCRRLQQPVRTDS
jgi:hypothetical protein